MRKINILRKNVYNKIAAGEVVDGPYSIVKELVENSIDAESTQIDVYIENGGKSYIKVVDNGCGIERDDLRFAYCAHATSKILNPEDLHKIHTLGFRGEALASIASVSMGSIASVVKGQPAYIIYHDGFNVGYPSPTVLAKGTTVCINNLFFNTPVRLKFLNSDAKERADIVSCMNRFILSYPNISFRLYSNDELILQSDGDGLESAIARIYGAETISKCYKIDAEYFNVKLTGFIGNQNFFKSNKTYQSLFLNGRYIVNSTISAAINNAYAAYSMRRQYPFYVLNMTVPIDSVDVNVHPNKIDVRFVDDRAIFSAVHRIISSILDGTADAAKFIAGGTPAPEIKSTMESSEEVKPQKPERKTPTRVFTFGSSKPKNSEGNARKINYYDPLLDEPIYHPQDELPLFKVADNSVGLNEFDKNALMYEARDRYQYEQQMIEFESRKFRGALFDTYLIYEIKNTLYIIDQHAAHERLLYDKLVDQYSRIYPEVQGITPFYTFATNEKETEFINRNLTLIHKLGFDIEPFAIGSFRLSTVPFNLADMNVKTFIDELLSHIDEFNEITLPDILRDKLAKMACKNAIKAGDKLTDKEVDVIFEMLDGNLGLKCPHGRPICVEVTKKELEKLFKRIV